MSEAVAEPTEDKSAVESTVPSDVRSEEVIHRDMKFETRKVDEKKRTAELSFSSEREVERWYGIEILNHTDGAIDMTRLNDGAALLLNHDPDKQIGVVERAWMEGKRGKAIVRFGRSPLAEEIFQDVRDGIRQLVSVGYVVNDRSIQRDEKTGLETHRVTSWSPLEISIVSVPADPGVGVGREIELKNQDQNKPQDNQPTEERQTMSVEVINEQVEKAVGEKLNPALERFQRTLDEIKAKSEKPELLRTGKQAETKELRQYNLCNAINSFCERGNWGDGIEKEISDNLKTRYNHKSDRFVVPFSVRNVTTDTSGTPYGGYTQDVVVQQPVDALRAQTFFDRIGATILQGLSGSVQIPILRTPSTVVKNTEGGTLSGTGDPVFAQETLEPLIVQGQVKVSKSLLATGVTDVGAMIQRDLEKQIANKMEAFALTGAGSSGEPQGLKTLSGATTSVASGTNGTAYSYLEVLKTTQDTSAANASLDRSRFLTSMKGFGKLRRTEISSNTALFAATYDGGTARIADFPAVISNNVPSTDTKGSGTNLTQIYFGDWSYMVVGMFGAGMEIIVDPYTEASKNLVVINAIALYDIAWTQPAAFARLLEAITT